jgi:hypothetical protein
MKNVTLSLDTETHRNARIIAAEKGVSLSGLVREYLQSLPRPSLPHKDAIQSAFAAMDEVEEFSASDRMTREELHER